MKFQFLDLNECEPNPCVYSTGCIDGANDYMCTCLPGYTGKNCEAGEWKVIDCLGIKMKDCFDYN